MRIRELAEKPGRLLPLALARDVRIVSPPESEDRQQVRVRAVVVLKVVPRLVIKRGDVRKRCRSEEHTSELQSRLHLVCRLLLEKKKLVPRALSPELRGEGR